MKFIKSVCLLNLIFYALARGKPDVPLRASLRKTAIVYNVKI